jgi:hypothetical protein
MVQDLKKLANEIGREKTGEEKMGLFLRPYFLTRRLLKNPKTFNKIKQLLCRRGWQRYRRSISI